MHSRLEVARDHPAFAGHFPKFPVLPGAVLLDAALHVIESERGIDLTQWQIASVKFLDVVRPGDVLGLRHDACSGGLIRFTVLATDRGKDRTVASGSLSSGAPTSAPRPAAVPPGTGA
jgi:3-hydroxymyristoyl/3-hydroxydecanoyl-(acyl carrier protein) dehydratase